MPTDQQRGKLLLAVMIRSTKWLILGGVLAISASRRCAVEQIQAMKMARS
jgi:hypothetical protein